jgi:hypothetical protein
MGMHDTHHNNAPPDLGESVRRGHETTDVPLRPVLWGGLALTVAAIVGHLVLGGFFAFFNSRLAADDPRPAPLANREQTPPEPRLQVSPRQDWREMLEQHTHQIESYGWVDQPGGAVRIPIDRAMDLVLERGLPARQAAPGQIQSPNNQESDDLESEGGQPPEQDGKTQPNEEEPSH